MKKFFFYKYSTKVKFLINFLFIRTSRTLDHHLSSTVQFCSSWLNPLSMLTQFMNSTFSYVCIVTIQFIHFSLLHLIILVKTPKNRQRDIFIEMLRMQEI